MHIFMLILQPWGGIAVKWLRRYYDEKYPHNAFKTSIFDENPGQGDAPPKMHMPSLLDILENPFPDGWCDESTSDGESDDLGIYRDADGP